MNMYEIIDDFLDKDLFKSLQLEMMGPDFPWFYQFSMTDENKNDGSYFSHFFFKEHEIKSEGYHKYIKHILNNLKCNSLIRARANLQLKREKVYYSGLHTDLDFSCKTSIFYINTNNGFTLLNKKDKIDCKENRMLIFNSLTKHQSVSQTDIDQRIVINFNYF